MKLTIILTIFVLTMSFQRVDAQRIQYDKYVRRQLQSMVFIRWGKFKPWWYYWLKHNKYRKGEDRRTLLQLAPTILATGANKVASNEQKKDTEVVFRQSVWTESNIVLEAHYHLYYQKVFDSLHADIESGMTYLAQHGAAVEVLQKLTDEHQRINHHITIIRKGMLMPGTSARAMANTETELRTLRKTVFKYACFYQIYQKHAKP